MVKIHFHVTLPLPPSPFVPFNFGQKLPIRTAHHIFPESRHPDGAKNPYYVLSPERDQKNGTRS